MKRSYNDAFDDEPMIKIKLAACDDPVLAELLVVRTFSYCARKLPETDTWDLTNVLIDGEPVTRSDFVA